MPYTRLVSVRKVLLCATFLLAVAPTRALSLEWSTSPGFRQANLEVANGTRAGLILTDPRETGIHFTNQIPEARHLTNQILLNGSGIAAGDFDDDGLTDLFFAGFDNENALYRNLGNWRFEDVTATAGVAWPGVDCTGAAFADLTGDAKADLIINSLSQGTRVLINDGAGHFRPHSQILNPGHGAMSVACADVDGDGFLDLYITQYRTRALMDMPGTRMTFKKLEGRTVVETVNGRPVSDPEFLNRFAVNALGGIEENGEPDILYRNIGGTNFLEVPWTGGSFLDDQGKALTTPPRDWGLAAMFRDANGDRRPDLYVCNDFQSPDRLWINAGGGRFTEAPPLAMRHTSLSSMAVDFADINRDGKDDFIVIDMMSRHYSQRLRWVRDSFPYRPVPGRFTDRPQFEQNTLQLNTGVGSWVDIAPMAGLEATEWSWGCAFLDVDLDGWEDLLVVNGMERAARDQDGVESLRAARSGRRLTPAEIFQARKVFPRLATPNLAFRNQGDLTFREVSREWGFSLTEISQAIALADLDNDGDLDVVVGNLNAAAAVYRNDAPAPRLAVRLRGRPPNTRGIGARIEVEGGPIVQSQEMIAGGRYLSGDDPVRSFAAGKAQQLIVRVRWPAGAISELKGIPPNTLVEVSEPAPPEVRDPQPPSAARPANAPRFFEELTRTLGGHGHTELDWDDYARQPLLPFKLSQWGPGLNWTDLDNDGDADLLVGASKGGKLAAFRNQGRGAFIPWKSNALSAPAARDVLGLITWPRHSKPPAVLVAYSNYEDGAPLGNAVSIWDPAEDKLTEIVPADASSVGPLAMADIDGDGDLDLFVGGRVVAGRWPEPASSRFFRNDDGRFILDAGRSRALSGIGNVTGAVFTDADADGDADLALACQWGSLRILRQDPETFTDVTSSFGLSGLKGLWTSITAADLNNDGRMDLVAGNWGRNSHYQRYFVTPWSAEAPDPVRIYYGDFNEDGVLDILESHYEPERKTYVPEEPLSVLASVMPSLRGRFPSHLAYSKSDVAQVLGDASPRATVLGLNWIESTAFLNRGEHFEPRPLPAEAQFSPVFALGIADIDGDGSQDIFAGQNFFELRPHVPRCDAGLGFWLLGNGDGTFRVLSPERSGIEIPGEARAAAVADFDQDGRVDFAVSQNGAETRLFRNVDGRPGLRVRLEGAPDNPAGVGATVRWAGKGVAAHEIHLGGGGIGQDDLCLVLDSRKEPHALELRWPGGTPRSYEIQPSWREIVLTAGGEARVLSPR